MKKIIMALSALILAMCVGNAFADDLTLGVGDLLRITVFGNTDMTTETRVGESGQISVPLIGQVKVSGLTNKDAEQLIATKLDKGGFLRKPQVHILVTDLQSQQISVLGQVLRPGRYPLTSLRSVTALIAMAGGVGAEGGDDLTLIRDVDGKQTKTHIDLYKLIHSGSSADDVLLQANDILYVERADKFYIYGEVQRPGGYRLERDMTVLEALSTGGGLTARGTERGMIVKRQDADGQTQQLKLAPDAKLAPGDIIYVKESWF